MVVFVGVSFGAGMLGLLVVRSLVVSELDGKKKMVKGKGVAVAGDERVDGLRGFEWKKLTTGRGWKGRKTWSELGGKVRSWEVWGVERV